MDTSLACKDYVPQYHGAVLENKHPRTPRSNVASFSSYDPSKYVIKHVNQTLISSECMTPLGPPRLTQQAIAKYLVPTTRELDEVPPCLGNELEYCLALKDQLPQTQRLPRVLVQSAAEIPHPLKLISPSFDELPDAVIDRMLSRDKAFWVCSPGKNAYELTDAFYRCGLATTKVLPTPQSVFPRSYEYDWKCITERRRIACLDKNRKTPVPPQCRDCEDKKTPGYSPFQIFWLADDTQKRWKYYPDLNADLSLEEIKSSMKGVGRPFKHEACTWYNDNYPSRKYNFIIRKFSG